MGYEVKGNEVAIIVAPQYDEDGSWNGTLTTGMVIGGKIQESLAGSATIHASLTMAASLIYADKYPDFEDALEDIKIDIVKDLFPEHYEQTIQELADEEEQKAYKKQGNVLSLNAWTKTKGSA